MGRRLLSKTDANGCKKKPIFEALEEKSLLLMHMPAVQTKHGTNDLFKENCG